MRKELLHVMPPIITFPSINAPLSIALARQAPYSWFYNRFVQLYGTLSHMYTLHGCFIDGDTSPASCPFITRNVFTRKYIDSNFDSFSSFAIHCINSDYYVYAFLDRFYNEKSENFQKTHFPHQLFICGYDTDKEVFIGADFFHGIYRFEEISFYAIDNGYLCYGEAEGTNIGEYPDVVTYAYKPVQWNFSFAQLISSLKDYWNKMDSTQVFYYWFPEKLRKNFKYGMDYYDILYSLIDQNILDMRAFHILYEHKKMMGLRLEYLKEQYGFEDGKAEAAYRDMTQNALLIRNLLLKSDVTPQAHLSEKIMKTLNQIKESETSILPEFISNLERFSQFHEE